MKKVLCFFVILFGIGCLLLGTNVMSDQAMAETEHFSLVTENQPLTIVIDPGHGGTDDGATRVYDGVTVNEKKLNLTIALALQKELQSYKNVKVYLTRDSDTTISLGERGSLAMAYMPDLMISIHNNAKGLAFDFVDGSCVLVSSGQYRKTLAEVESEIGNAINQELNQYVGTSDQGLLLRLSDKTYPNGALRDYYAIVNQGINGGYPAIIVEHAFVDNISDYLNFLNEDSKLEKLGIADATAIAKYYGLEKKDGSVSYQGNGRRVVVKGDWMKMNNQWYLLDETGNNILTGWQKSGNRWYYMNKNGVMQTGWQKIGNVWYYLDSSGAMVTGWKKLGNTWYYMDNSGAMVTGWKKLGKVWYYMDNSGAMVTGWKNINDKWYYMNANGAMMTGWQFIDNKWYYMYASGQRAQNVLINGYQLNEEGVYIANVNE